MGIRTIFHKKNVESVDKILRSYSSRSELKPRHDKRYNDTSRGETCTVCEYPIHEGCTSREIERNISSRKNERQSIDRIDSERDSRGQSSQNTTSCDDHNVNFATSTDDRMKLNLNLAHYISEMTQALVYVPFCIIIVSILIYNFCFQATVRTGLGDGKRSPESSYTFFESVDRDGDGVLKAQEVAYFLEDHIGGASFDTSSEVNEEVSSLMKDLDRDHDEGLDKGDVFAYWNNLESLLTADEVKEWVENALQLPEYIGDIFKENGVTGYDFPELVEHDGLSLREDLGINKPAFRKKILRHINARLLGVGTVPDSPNRSEVKYSLESCSTVSFTWVKPDARGFPVHSYKVQRRDIDLHSSSVTHSDLNVFPELKSPWVNIYCGGEPQFHDNTLKLGNSFIYRIQAWNSVGRSEWVDIDITPSLKKKKCTDPPQKQRKKNEVPRGMYGMQSDSMYNSISHSFAFAESVITVIAIIATLMKIRRAYAPSSMNPPKSWVTKYLGLPIFSPLSQESEHDNYVKAVGLNGYKTSVSMDTFSELDNPSKRRKKLIRSSSDNGFTSTQSFDESTPQSRGIIQKTPSEKIPLCQPNVEYAGIIEKDTSFNKRISKRWKFKRFSLTFDRKPDRITNENISKISTPPLSEAFDDYTKCNTCHKAYKVGKRYRHHCARCLATFCHKHGRITHSNFTSCKVPGTCICNVCLNTEFMNRK